MTVFWTVYLPLSALTSVLLFHWLSNQKQLKRYKIQAKVERKIPSREIAYTMINLLIFAAIGWITDFLEHMAYLRLYDTSPNTPLEFIYFLASFLLALGMHDIYFYTTHRLLHFPFLFQYVHHIHHRSHYATPWSAFSFHPIEGVLLIGIVPLVLLLLPLHSFVAAGFVGFLMLVSVYGHNGHEYRASKHPIFNIFQTAIHHDIHHRKVHSNFGIYLTLWDNLFSTADAKTEDEINAFKEQLKHGH
jgi:Delta7-sterol 5-desaturase